VLANLIGTTADGSKALGNFFGVYITGGASKNIIGSAGAGNVISGNVDDGVTVYGSGTTGNQVLANFIGTTADGKQALANVFGLVIFGGASNNTVGAAGAGNVISGNNTGVWINGSGTTGNQLLANFIGTTADGTAALANGVDGVLIGPAASNNTVGAAGAGNVISGNGYDGIEIGGSSTTGNQVLANFIGTTADGSHPLGNGNSGVTIYNGATGNTVGAAGAGNVISSNAGDGVQIGVFFDITDKGTTGNQVLANFIGTSAGGTEALGNGGNGVAISTGANNNTVGAAGAGNVISGNAVDGILITDNGTTANQVLANLIGTSADGSHPLGNGFAGVLIRNGASKNMVGAKGARNVISGNTSFGVDIYGGGTTGNQVLANFIGTTADGSHALGNFYGVIIAIGASANTIGAAGTGNVISGNSQDGILLTDSGTTGNQVLANLIGTTADAGHPLGNGVNGVFIEAGASNNAIGGVGAGNLIAFNQSAGVVIVGNSATGDTISQNAILGNGGLGIDLGGDGVTPNSPGGPHTGPNNLQNYPVLNPYTNPGTVTGTLNSTPNTTFVLEFFANPAPDPSGHGQGQDYLGSEKVTTDAAGNVTFTFTYTPPAGEPYLSATATDAAGNTSEFSATVDAALTPAGLTLAGTEGAQVSGTMATFTDADPAATAASFTASIAWGDGAVTAGTVLANPKGGFLVTGSHTYAEEASTLPVTVTITDVPANAQVTANSLVNVADAPLTVNAPSVSAVEGATFSGQVGTFTDADPNGTRSDYVVVITWGDGTVSAGTVSALGNGLFAVSGKHTYAEEGKHTLSLSVQDAGGATATGSGTATVADAPLQATGKSVSLHHKAFSGVLATFTDADPAGVLGDYAATIDGATARPAAASSASPTASSPSPAAIRITRPSRPTRSPSRSATPAAR
jgi:hypothetical protein